MFINFSRTVCYRVAVFTIKVNFKSCVSAMSGDSKPYILFVLGAPGSGKGTQCEKIVEKFKFTHLSAGDLLRAERNTPESPYGTLIETHIKNGSIVPVEITCSLIERAIINSSSNHFLVDGFPRNQDNLLGWKNVMSEKVNVLGVLFLECTQEACMQRCLARGAAGSGRSDDNEESLRKRFVTYQQDTLPIVNHYREQNAVYSVDSTKTQDAVFSEVSAIIERLAPDSKK